MTRSVLVLDLKRKPFFSGGGDRAILYVTENRYQLLIAFVRVTLLLYGVRIKMKSICNLSFTHGKFKDTAPIDRGYLMSH